MVNSMVNWHLENGPKWDRLRTRPAFQILLRRSCASLPAMPGSFDPSFGIDQSTHADPDWLGDQVSSGVSLWYTIRTVCGWNL